MLAILSDFALDFALDCSRFLKILVSALNFLAEKIFALDCSRFLKILVSALERKLVGLNEKKVSL